MSESKGNRLLVTVMVVTPAVIAPLVIAGVYLGYFVGEQVGYSKTILAIAFSTAGFLLSIAILVKVIRRLVARGAGARSRPSSEPLPSPSGP